MDYGFFLKVDFNNNLNKHKDINFQEVNANKTRGTTGLVRGGKGKVVYH